MHGAFHSEWLKAFILQACTTTVFLHVDTQEKQGFKLLTAILTFS